MEENINYIDLIDDAKINLSHIINEKVAEYKKNQTQDLKKEIIDLINDRKKIFMFNKSIIQKYI